MVMTLRTKLLLGLVPLVLILIGLGSWSILMFSRLGSNIDVILKENYRSVRYAERMKEALERMDSALLFAIGGEEEQAKRQFGESRPIFEENLALQQENVTLIAEGERELSAELAGLFSRYVDAAGRYFAVAPTSAMERRRMYFGEMLPTFQAIKNRADEILRINQLSMEEMDRRARSAATMSSRLTVVAVIGAVAAAIIAALALSRAVLEPILAVTRGARAMSLGNYDQVVVADTRDELGELAGAFNAMARRIREYQAAGSARLLRAQQTAQSTIDAFPDPVVVVDQTNRVERANPAAGRILGVVSTSAGAVGWKAPPSIAQALSDVLSGGPDFVPTSFEHTFVVHSDGQERHLLPRIVSIRLGGELLGAAVLLHDVTKLRLVDQLKSDMVSTVSHELKTPLTSMQMAVHLLLEEVVGPLNPKQVELLLAAREESDRMLVMINDLLDLTRIEQGHLRLDLAAVDPSDIISRIRERYRTRVEDVGIGFHAEIAPGLPPVNVDIERIEHVFGNLVENALAHTERGGWIRITAEPVAAFVRFTVKDSGEGISPEHVSQVFEKFYRGPGSRPGGAGLGLSISREIVVAHGGRIEVESQIGVGTTFRIWLPTGVARSEGEGRA
jgi:signal transduction histidine kinase/HAMP domain-containing protein